MKIAKLVRSQLPVFLLAIALLIAALLVLTRPTPVIEQEREKTWPVTVATVFYGAHQPQLVLLGYVESASNSQITAAVAADVIHTFAREGNLVEENELLIGLGATEALMRVALRESEVEDLEAQIELEKNNHDAALAAIGSEKELLELNQASVDREQQMFKKKLGSETGLDTARMAVERQSLAVTERRLLITNHPSRLNQLSARLKSARAQLELARLDLDRTNVRAPFAARVSRVHVAVGERVTTGAPIIDLYSADQLEVRALIPDRYLATVMRSMEQTSSVSAQVQHLGKQLSLKLDRLAGAVEEARGGTDGIFVLEEQASNLSLGKPVQLTLDLPPISDTLTIPEQAVFSDNRVYKVVDGRLQAVLIEKLGVATDGQGAPIVIARSEGLQPDDRYITTQLPNPVSGLKVEILSPAAPVGETSR